MLFGKETLLNSFGKAADESPEGRGENNANLDLNESQHSFFKNLPEVIVESNNTDVMNFELNEPTCGNQLNEGNLFANGSGHKDTRENFYFNATDILFSGYFGQKNEEDGFNGNKDAQKNNKRINPFPTIEEERQRQNSGMSYDALNGRNCKKQKLEKSASKSALSNSFLSNMSRNKNSFSDLVKSVSLTSSSSFCQKKKSKLALILEVLSSEQLELEKIKKEKEELRRLKLKNSHMAERVK
jgi:hypothetical protein